MRANMNNGEYADLRPVAELVGALSESIGRFLDKPTNWHGPMDAVQRMIAIDRVRQQVFASLHEFVENRLINKSLPDWLRGHDYSGRYSTANRAHTIKEIMEAAAPVPDETMGREVAAFLHDLRNLVYAAIRTAGGFVADAA